MDGGITPYYIFILRNPFLSTLALYLMLPVRVRPLSLCFSHLLAAVCPCGSLLQQLPRHTTSGWVCPCVAPHTCLGVLAYASHVCFDVLHTQVNAMRSELATSSFVASRLQAELVAARGQVCAHWQNHFVSVKFTIAANPC